MLNFILWILLGFCLGLAIKYFLFPKKAEEPTTLPLCNRHDWVKAVLLIDVPKDAEINCDADLDKYEKLVCKKCGFVSGEDKQLDKAYLKQILYQIQKKEISQEFQWYKNRKKNELLDKKVEELSKSNLGKLLSKDDFKQLLEIGMELEDTVLDEAANEQFYAKLEKEIRNL